MKNKLLEDFKTKIESTMNDFDKIENEILKLSKTISEMIQYKEGRIIFVGAGISADMAGIIIEELWFNFQIPKGKFISLTAAKSYAETLEKWKELEEIEQTSVFELEPFNINENDLVIGLSSSGRTSYVVSSLKFSKQLGAKTALITDTDKFPNLDLDFVVNTSFRKPIVVGLNTAEGATIQKLIIDNILYSALEDSGRIYKRQLVYLRPLSKKIEGYCITIIMNLLNVDNEEAIRLFEKGDRSLELTLISNLKKVSIDKARDLLYKNNGNFNTILS